MGQTATHDKMCWKAGQAIDGHFNLGSAPGFADIALFRVVREAWRSQDTRGNLLQYSDTIPGCQCIYYTEGLYSRYTALLTPFAVSLVSSSQV